ncbi:hypothetical protein GGR26_003051 [Lewinella marina]|uniref:Uncharacterized protein n=1 Tax=Neolewinella marina TaxID=438751 RepID=A0A2G0CEK9_9BACT|nr:hypothetical protein [Neolewinella marina]NJB87271.1 hypothetical protein [Neolewinella marina]PHK98405.1 hypothetical protein CGL56_11975 [Neolewinella marina]
MQKALLPLLFACLATGCNSLLEDFTDLKALEQHAEYAIPLVDSRLDLSGLVGQVDERFVLTIDPDGLLRFNYTDTVPSVDSEPVFAALQAVARGLPLPITMRRQELDFPLPNDASIDLLRLRAGKLSYSLPNPYPHPVTVRLTLPNLQRNGVAFTVSGELPARAGSGANPTLTNAAAPLDLAGYELRFPDETLVIDYAIDAPDGTPLDPGRGTIAVLSDLDFSFLEGYFGRTPYSGVDDRLEIDFFENYRSGEVTFENPRILVSVRNSVGVPARAVVEELTVETLDGRVIPVEGEIVEEGFDFNYPREPGQNSYTTYEIDKTNSDLLELLAARPVALNYRISALINPEADPRKVGFLSDTSSYSATVTAELPLYGSAANFEVVDTFDVNLGDRYGDITAASLRITTDSEWPLDLLLSGTFTDSLGLPLLDLTDGELLIVKASPVDAGGTPTGSVQSTHDVTFSADRLELLRRASHLVLSAAFATLDGGSRPVRITNQQKLRVRIGARLTVDKP